MRCPKEHQLILQFIVWLEQTPIHLSNQITRLRYDEPKRIKKKSLHIECGVNALDGE